MFINVSISAKTSVHKDEFDVSKTRVIHIEGGVYNDQGLSKLGKLMSLLFVHASWGWRTRTSSRFIKNRPADFGRIKPPAFLNLSFFFLILYFILYVCTYFVFRFKPSGSNLTLIRASMCEGTKVNRLEVRTRKRTAALCFAEVQGFSCS